MQAIFSHDAEDTVDKTYGDGGFMVVLWRMR